MRDTIHQTLIDDGINPEIVKMVTGKKLSISDYLRAKIDNLKLALEHFAKLRPLAAVIMDLWETIKRRSSSVHLERSRH